MARLTKGNRSIAGRVAIVTGAASGMGRATAHLFADEGAKVAVIDLGDDRVKTVVDEITAAGGTAQGWVLDVSDQAAVDGVVNDVRGAFGPIDILVNNAGIALPAPFAMPATSYLDAWNRTFDVDLTAHVLLIQACLADLQRNGEGRVVNIASTEGLGATAANSPYVAAKHGVIGLTKGLAVELGRTGVTFNCICPGPIRTGMTAGIPDDAKDKFARRRVPLRRYGEPEEVAHMTLSLVLPAASFTNGVVIPVDGGMTSQNT
ncbi:MAG TPA: SDR family NAD(P)-dependent oxidoreductase [Acidimicrobiales bacterium]|nr:SDR family NAD(P)-dependent oxidoreductase [Acidimicrobiales bacterium]